MSGGWAEHCYKPILTDAIHGCNSAGEMEVLKLLAQHMTAQEIAQKLVVSDQTVNRHRVNIYQKLGAHSHRQAVATADALGLLPSASRSGPLE